METTVSRNNEVTIEGVAITPYEYSHEMYCEKFYKVYVEVRRLSDVTDVIPVIVSDRLVDVKDDMSGSTVRVTGQFRSYNKRQENEERSKLILSLFATQFNHADSCGDINDIKLKGFICKKPVYRKTPLGREIADVLLAVNREHRKSDYIPCICWGRNARFLGNLDVGTQLNVTGRIQSRDYQKKLSETETEKRTAYEVSISTIEVITPEED